MPRAGAGQYYAAHRQRELESSLRPVGLSPDEQREICVGEQTSAPNNRRLVMFVNLTPHAVTLQSADGTRFTVPPSGTVARIDSKPGDLIIIEGCDGFDAGIALYDRTNYGTPVGLPDPVDGTTYIVSALFAGRVGDRIDVVYPGTGPKDGCIRDEKGQVVAVTRLIRA